MPICFMPGRSPGKKDEVGDQADSLMHSQAHQEWREPPGYLGEAVRRAKRIASLSRLHNSSQPASGDC
jgi:hypothetical protein